MKHATTRQSLATTLALCLLLLTAATPMAFAQSTTAFTHQGRLTDNGAPANGAYDLQFALFDALNGGAQQGATLTRDDVAVTNGVFTVQLDFGATPFNGAARWLQISVRAGASTGAFTLLNPRQPLSATPYAMRSQSAASADNATQLGGVAASQYVQGTDTRLNDARSPTAGSANYIQNTTTLQAASSFNISGDGTAGGTLSGDVVNAAIQFNLNGNRILSNAGGSNLFAGVGAGAANTSGAFNSFFGARAGQNATTGSGNVFLGNDTGLTNVTGSSNTLLGSGANISVNGLSFATAIGAGAVATFSNSLVLGRNNGMDRVRVPGGFLANVALNDSFLLLRSGADLSQRINYDSTINGLAVGAPGGFHWLNTTDGGSQEQMKLDSGGNLTLNGGLTVGSEVTLNDHGLRMRGGIDNNHVIFYNRNVDGIEFRANDQFVWTRGIGFTTQMHLRSNGSLYARGGFNGRCVSGDFLSPDLNCNQDLAETFRTKEQTEAGDVVTLIPQDHERPTVRRSQRAYDEHLVGVVSSNPGLVFDEGETRLAGANDHYITKDKTVVAAVGRVPVKFTLENGAINVGDPLTSSATEPGKAMKATGAGKIIGLALESSAKAQDGPTKDKLLMWLQVGYHAPAAPTLTMTQRRKTTVREPRGMAQLKAENAALKAQQNGQQQQLAELKAQLAAVLARLPKPDQAADKQASEQR